MIKVAVTPCPACQELIEIEHPYKGQIVECPDCAEVFKITALEPVELHYAYPQNNEAEFTDEAYPRH